MRFESITAHAFGPMMGKTIELAPSMTVIYGPNESGKSTWQAALYSALCGIRRVKGIPRNEDRDFAAKHKPWDGQTWEVSVRLSLDDGRRVELRHDLTGKAGSQATDLTLGRDVSGDVINEGTVDGARLLGLDRHSFLGTACVRQADILGIRKDAELLQEHLQRAAATARTDATATEAIARLESFQTEHVGRHWVKTRPLGKALERLSDAEEKRTRALEAHNEFLRLSGRAEELRIRAETLQANLRLVEAAAATRDAEATAVRLSRARVIVQSYPGGPPPPLRKDDEVVRKVAAAIAAWEGRPRVSELRGQSAADLQQRIGALPPMPEGDLEPHPAVLVAKSAYNDATRVLELHEKQRPLEPMYPDTKGASEQELRGLARDLETAEPSIDPTLQGRLEFAKRRMEHITPRPRLALLIGFGLIGVAAGFGLVVSGASLPGVVLLVAAVAIVAWRLVAASGARTVAVEEVRAAENALGEARHAVAEALRRKTGARNRANALGLPVDPVGLQSLADQATLVEQQRRQFDRWFEYHQSLSERVTAALGELTAALRGRGIQVGDSAVLELETYLSACAERSRLAAEARSRPDLESQLATRLAAEEARQRALDAQRSLEEAAASCGVVGKDPEAMINGLKVWQAGHTAALEQHQKALQEWAELQTLLGGKTIGKIEEEATRKNRVAESQAVGLDAEQISVLSRAADLDERLARLRGEVEEALRNADRVRGQVEDRTHWLPNVAEAEEEVDRAKQELDRVRQLERALERTLEFLERAQEKVHRDIAPILAQTVKRWLPEVTDKRYTDAKVDPEMLEVRVRDSAGRWREAALLSHGTAEQVYLLLRVALAEHLSKPGESCPLILDDVTVQSDRMRTEAIMRCLHMISSERQIIVFTQEEEVLRWGETSLDAARDKLIRLDPLNISA